MVLNMRNKDFFIPGRKYKFIEYGEPYWTTGKIYKCVRLYNDSTWVEIEVDERTTSLRDSSGMYTNGLSDGYWTKPLDKIWELVADKKEHLPSWF